MEAKHFGGVYTYDSSLYLVCRRRRRPRVLNFRLKYRYRDNLKFNGFHTYSAVASNRPTEALASVISLAFVVYST